MPKLTDLTGKKFGRWTVLSLVKPRRPQVHWLCRCECGKTKPVVASGLMGGKSTQCAECAVKGLKGTRLAFKPGDRAGSWTIIRHDPESGLYLCRCDCGTTGLRQTGMLRKRKGCAACWGKAVSEARRAKKVGRKKTPTPG